MRIAIDFGHGINTAGKRTPLFEDGSYMKEFYFNQAVGLRVISLLKDLGVFVVSVNDKTGVVDYSYQNRVDRANDSQADLFVSIHANAYEEIKGVVEWNDKQGILFYANENKPEHIAFGRAILKEVIKIYPYSDKYIWLEGSIKQSLCKYSNMPTAIIECGFMTNKLDAELLLSEQYRSDVANAIVQGIMEFAKERGLEMAETINEATKEQAEKSIDRLAMFGVTDSPDFWKGKLNEAMPVYAHVIMLDRIITILEDRIDELEKGML